MRDQKPLVLRGSSAGAGGGSLARADSVVVIKEGFDSVLLIVPHCWKSSV